jgi:hypothetical protein
LALRSSKKVPDGIDLFSGDDSKFPKPLTFFSYLISS